MSLSQLQLSEPLIAAMVTLLSEQLNGTIDELNATITDGYTVPHVAQFLPYVPVPSTLEAGIPAIGCQELPAEFEDDLQFSVHAKHRYAVVCILQNSDHQTLALQLRRMVQAIAFTVQTDRMLGTAGGSGGIMRVQGGAWSVNFIETTPVVHPRLELLGRFPHRAGHGQHPLAELLDLARGRARLGLKARGARLELDGQVDRPGGDRGEGQEDRAPGLAHFRLGVAERGLCLHGGRGLALGGARRRGRSEIVGADLLLGGHARCLGGLLLRGDDPLRCSGLLVRARRVGDRRIALEDVAEAAVVR